MQRKKFVKAADHAPPAAGSYVKVLPGIEFAQRGCHVYAIGNGSIPERSLKKHAHGTSPKTHPTRKHANTQ